MLTHKCIKIILLPAADSLAKKKKKKKQLSTIAVFSKGC